MLLSGAKMMVKGLEEEGVVLAFGIPGVGILELFDAFRESSIKTVLVTHEQSASFMADAYNKVTGKVGVCCSIGGPGLTNMLTGLAEAYLDSSAVVVIISSPRNDDGKSFHRHQINQNELLRPIVKKVFKVEQVEDLSRVIPEAFKIAKDNEPGPVAIDIPANIFREKAYFEISPQKKIEELRINKDQITEITDLLLSSKYLSIFAGKGSFGAAKEVAELAEILSAPVATTISGRGIIPEDHPLALGCGFGIGSSHLVYDVLKESDVVLALGCKFSELSSAEWNLKLPANLIHIDKNKDVFNKNYIAKIVLASDVKIALRQILDTIKGQSVKARGSRIFEGIKVKKEKLFTKICRQKLNDGVSAEKLFHVLRQQI